MGKLWDFDHLLTESGGFMGCIHHYEVATYCVVLYYLVEGKDLNLNKRGLRIESWEIVVVDDCFIFKMIK